MDSDPLARAQEAERVAAEAAKRARDVADLTTLADERDRYIGEQIRDHGERIYRELANARDAAPYAEAFAMGFQADDPANRKRVVYQAAVHSEDSRGRPTRRIRGVLVDEGAGETPPEGAERVGSLAFLREQARIAAARRIRRKYADLKAKRAASAEE